MSAKRIATKGDSGQFVPPPSENLPRAGAHGLSFLCGTAKLPDMATGRKDDDREAEFDAAIEAIRVETWKTGQTLPKLRHAIALDPAGD